VIEGISRDFALENLSYEKAIHHFSQLAFEKVLENTHGQTILGQKRKFETNLNGLEDSRIVDITNFLHLDTDQCFSTKLNILTEIGYETARLGVKAFFEMLLVSSRKDILVLHCMDLNLFPVGSPKDLIERSSIVIHKY
jgi:hypothetical protein